MKTNTFPAKQHGAASLLTALVLLISITLIGLLTAKTVLVETQITADNYRISQATSAASAAMDRGVAYFMAGGLDHDDNDAVDFTLASPSNFTLTAGTQTTSARFYFDNTAGNICDCPAGGCVTATNMTRGLVTAKGWSDDGLAERTITQCVGTFDPFGNGDGPSQPFVGRAGANTFGSATIINRYTNSSIWSGGPADTTGAAFATYLRPSGKEVGDYTDLQLDSICPAAPCNVSGNPLGEAQLVSNEKSGNGIDIIASDPTLGSKTSAQFWDMFFSPNTQAQIKNAAAATGDGQLYVGGTAPPSGTEGLIWIDNPGGNVHIAAGNVLGSPKQPAIVIVNGDLTLNGGATVYGILYVMGQLHISGSPIVKGSILAEAGIDSGGGGNLTLVYKPWGADGDGTSPPFIAGTGAVIAGSWKDW